MRSMAAACIGGTPRADSCRAAADQIQVENGDVLHGEVISMIQGKLVFKTQTFMS